MSLAQKTTVGILWNFLEKLGRRGVGVVVTLLLARFLTPDDYGLVAITAVFVAVANSLMDFGFSSALIRKKNPNPEYFNTAFYSNIFLGILAYFALFLIAPFVSIFYEELQLTVLIRVVGIVVVINSFQVVQYSILTRDLNFKAQLKVAIPASFISGICAVIMAYIGFGVWALIAQTILSSIVFTVLVWNLNIWKPSFLFSRSSLYEMFGFGSKLFLSSILDKVHQNIYIIVIAKIFTTTVAGHYFFASRIKELILLQLVNSIQVVTYPALSKLQDDNIKLRAAYRKVILVTTFILFPALTIMVALAKPVFILFLNDKWLPAIPYLQLMCISGLMYPLHSINLNVLIVKGRSDLFLNLELIKKIISWIILAVTIQFGVIGILVGQVVASIFSYIPNSYYSDKLIGYSAQEQIRDVLPTLLLSIMTGSLIYVGVEISTRSALFELLFFGSSGIILYLVSSYFVKLESIELTRQLLKDKIWREA